MDSSANGFYEFGPFGLDAKERLLLRDGHVLTLTPKAFDTLLLLVENSRHVLTKEELMRRLWPDTFVEEANLTNNISILRKVLGETHNGQLYIQTVPRVGYRFVRTVTCDGSAREVKGDGRSAVTGVNQPESAAASPPESLGRARQEAPASFGNTGVENLNEQAIRISPLPSSRLTSSAEYLISAIKRRKLGALLSLATLVLAAAGSAYIAYLIYQRPKINERPTQYSLARLTFDPGLQTEPTWSADGRFIAYTSDRSGNFDIWVQQVDGGNQLQITHSPAHDWQPDWSPDGTNLVFRSEREGGGLFVVPVLGGLERKVSSFGYYPRWSPDGSKILFSDSSMPTPPVKVASKLYLATLDGEAPREVLLPDFSVGFDGLFSVCWHPDSQRISFVAKHAKLGWGFWTVPLAGGPPVKSEVMPAVEKQLEGFYYNFRWAPSGKEIYFEMIFRGVTNLWKVVVDPATLRWVAGPQRLTTGSGIDTEMAVSRDGKRLAFSTRTETIRVWSLPFNARTGQIKGEGRPLTAPGIVPIFSDLSPDGKKLVFTAGRLGSQKRELWEKSLEDGAERLLTVRDNEYEEMTPRWSRDGTRISYKRVVWNAEHTDAKFEIVILHVGSNDEQVVPLEADAIVSDWSADGQWLLGITDYQNPRHFSVCLFPVSATHAEKEMRVVASDPADSFFAQRFSPDDRWISFNAVKARASSTIYVVPWSGGKTIRITDGKYWSDKPHWSPDGKILYFVSNHTTGFFNVWGIHFDPQEGKPIGEPFQVTSYEDPGKMIWPSLVQMTLSLTEDRLVLPIREVTGSIWMLENLDR
jgi:Tol biopolymer transport system component/DNA-binding winged helix-turn-helix (wHTH) protein